ncbi:MAG: hypothetical protein J6K58_00040 [Lachnospiraceae bacterium]|nr:hypothetical protein [Lachnospiraceae bacterium]
MENLHSKYYQYDAKNAMKHYIKELRIRKGVWIVVCAFLLISLIMILLEQKRVWLFWGIYILIILTMFAYILGQQICFRKLMNILLLDCDPQKMFEIIAMIEQRDKQGKARNNCAMLKAQCCFYILGREEEGYTYLNKVSFKKKRLGNETRRLLLYANYYKRKKDWQNFELVKKDLLSLPQLIRHKHFEEKDYDVAVQFINLYELQRDGRTQEARTLLNKLLCGNCSMLNRVCFQMCLAELDLMEGEYHNAKQHLEFVIRNGNTLYHVSEAKEKMAMLQQQLL